MKYHLFLFAMLVGVAWGQRVLPANGPVLLPVTMATTTAQPKELPQLPQCVSNEAVSSAEEDLLNNPEDEKYKISSEESQELLTALEAAGIARNESLLKARNAEFNAIAERRASIRWSCPSYNSYCPHRWQRLVSVRHWGPCGLEYCRPLPWYTSFYAVCTCRSCYRGQGRCLPTGYRSRVLLAFCYHRALGWNIRAVRATLPSRCQCRRFCRG